MPGSKQNSQVSVLDSGLRHPPSPWEQIPEPREGGDTILGTSPESREVTAEAARSLCPYGASGPRLDRATCTVYQTKLNRQQTPLRKDLRFLGPAETQPRPPPPSCPEPAGPRREAQTREGIKWPMRGWGHTLRGTCRNRCRRGGGGRRAAY